MEAVSHRSLRVAITTRNESLLDSFKRGETTNVSVVRDSRFGQRRALVRVGKTIDEIELWRDGLAPNRETNGAHYNDQ